MKDCHIVDFSEIICLEMFCVMYNLDFLTNLTITWNVFKLSFSVPLCSPFSFTAVAFTTTLTGETHDGLKSPRTTVSQSAAVSQASVTAPALSPDQQISTKRYKQDAQVEQTDLLLFRGAVFSLEVLLMSFIFCLRVVKLLL